MYLIRSLRWKIILSPIDQITIFQSFNLSMTNYFINFLIPIRAGEVAKSILLKEIQGTQISKSLSTIYLDKITDLLPILLVLIIAPFFDKNIGSITFLAALLLVLVLIVFSLCLFYFLKKYTRISNLFEKILFFIPKNFVERLNYFVANLAEGFISLKSLSDKLIDVISLTILAFIVHCFFMWLFFFSFGIHLPIFTVLVGYSLLNVSFILPAPPGFTGSWELTFLLIFSYLYRYDKNLVSAVAASSHVFTAILFGLFGLAALFFIGAKASTALKLQTMGRTHSGESSP
jgi:uncharacterized protein (TIRG00374 family)